MAEFTEDVISRFEFINQLHPASFALFKADLNSTPVNVLCWVDTDNNNTIKPLGIILSEENMQDLEFDNLKLTKS